MPRRYGWCLIPLALCLISFDPPRTARAEQEDQALPAGALVRLTQPAAHRQSLSGMAFTADGKSVVVTTQDKLSLVDLTTGKAIREFENVAGASVVICPAAGNQIAAAKTSFIQFFTPADEKPTR